MLEFAWALVVGLALVGLLLIRLAQPSIPSWHFDLVVVADEKPASAPADRKGRPHGAHADDQATGVFKRGPR